MGVAMIEILNMKDILHSTYEIMEWKAEHRGELTGVDTGFADLNALTNGLQTGYHILAGAPGQGKSVLLKDLIMNSNVPAGIISLEMTAEQKMERILTSETNIPYSVIQTGDLDERNWQTLMDTEERLLKKELYIVDKDIRSELDVITVSKEMVEKYGVKIIGIDYFQLIQCSQRGLSEIAQVNYVSQIIKGLSRDLDIPIIVLMSLSRAYTQRDNFRPEVSDLRSSGQLEHDADTIFLLWRPEQWFTDEQIDRVFQGRTKNMPDTLDGYAELIVGKARHAELKAIQLEWQGMYQRFIDKEVF